MLEVDRQSGGFTACNACPACPVASADATGVESATIPLGPVPWNLYPARNINTNGHIEVEYYNLLTSDGTIPLGICNSNMRFFKKLHQRSVRGAFFRLVYNNRT